ncbi:histidine phosphatase family protein [Altererythrobacter sp. B11]|uniref:SixA phosphatase family protein n=1 Tax=Altererythrobacter sp. B11 TaxID=2060312 RepID=UPI000DC72821|nr:histidine phosphatase family protein [Altererythrobacter sp. B11]BBC73692.1 histidine phosphatase family protein [Altererythrobacter sp. B11]
MKLLGLLRHAKSDWEDLSLRDFDRGLNARGRRGAALMGEHIREHGVRWDRLVASPALRVKLTLESARVVQPIEWEREAYLADADTLLTILRKVEGDPRTLLLAGHNPGLQDLIFTLVPRDEENELYVAASRKYPTATFAVLELDIDQWADAAPGCGRLVHFARPRDLDPELGPERLRS